MLIFIIIAWLSTAPLFRSETEGAALQLSPAQQKFADAADFAEVSDIVTGRCSMCHAAEPGYKGIHYAPKGVMLDRPEEIARHAPEIYLQAGVSHAMPPANVSFIEPEERAKIVAWYRGVTMGDG